MNLIAEQTMLEVFWQSLFDKFKEYGVTYSVIGNEQWQENAITGDVDLWVRKSDLFKAGECLNNACNELDFLCIKFKGVLRLNSVFEGKYCILPPACKEEAGGVIHLDVWSSFYWRGFEFLKESNIVENSDPKDGVMLSTPSLYLCYRILKDILYKGSIRGDVVVDESILMSDCRKILFEIAGQNMAEKICKFITRREFYEIEYYANRIRLSLVLISLSRPTRQIGQTIKYIFKWFKSRLTLKNGFILAVSGPDGVGKSTILEALDRTVELGRCFDKKYYFHTKFPFLKPIRSIFRNRQTDSHGSQRRPLEPYPAWRVIINITFYGINNILGNFWLLKKRIKSNTLVMFDRYYYDYLVQLCYSKSPEWMVMLFWRFMPKPDLIILLKNEPEIIFKRKQDLPFIEIQRQIDKYESVVNELGCEVFVVDTNNNLNDSTRRISKHIFELLAR